MHCRPIFKKKTHDTRTQHISSAYRCKQEMKTMDEYCNQQPLNLKVVRFELDFSTLVPVSPKPKKKPKKITIPTTSRFIRKRSSIPNPPPLTLCTQQKKGVNELVEELLDELYADQREWSTGSVIGCSHGSTAVSFVSSQSNCGEQTDAIERSYLESLDINELRDQEVFWENRLHKTGERLTRSVRARDRLRRQQKRLCAAVTVLLRQITGESGLRFGVTPGGGAGDGAGCGEGGYAEWLHAMRLVARLPAGVPAHFRRKLWLTLADRHLSANSIDWPSAERACFRGTALPDDTELGAQILKDLHRTGCSLFCGAEGRENQAMLRRVLLAYARWNKDVGYCQGFNMIAAIILEVMDKSESDSLKVMIYLVEAVLPDGYFADDLRGLSADMAAFRDLLRLRLPRLADHMDHLQRISDGGGVEPPLPDVFTMQWFLTLYATWLPRDSLLRIWDLVLLDGNEILLLTALAIWDLLQDRILSARSADEFYSCMGGGAGKIYEAGDALVARVVAFGSVPELPRLRNSHRYRVTPPTPPTTPPVFHPPLMQTMTKRGLRLFYSEDEGDSSDDGNKMALATVIPRREDRLGTGDRLSLDIGALKRQYARLRERQRQAHVILAAACARHAAVGVPTSPTSLTVNNLLLGKSAIVSARGRRLGPPPGAIPPSRHSSGSNEKGESRTRVRTSDTISWKEEKSRKYLSRRNSVKWKDIKKDNTEKNRKPSIDFDETGDGIIVSEHEANEMIASLRSRSSSETSSYSSHNTSSSDTSLCDDNERASDSDHELPEDNEKHQNMNDRKTNVTKTLIHCQDSEMNSSILEESKSTDSTNASEEIVNDKTVDGVWSTIPRESSVTEMSQHVSKESNEVKSIEDISNYLHSEAGEPLRTYIDGFDKKLKDSLVVSNTTESFNIESSKEQISPYIMMSPYIPRMNSEREIQYSLNTPNYNINSKSSESVTSTNVKSKQFTDLSPIDLTPCEFEFSSKSPIDKDFLTALKIPSRYKADLITRPPDIIDSLARYPNFVPDIDLSDKNVSDIDSPPRSPGAESVIVSEDEPPIQLNIDKYFEHSPEFFGARVTDANNFDIPNRRSAKRNIRQPKKPDSLNLQTSQNEKTFKEGTERASSLPHSHSFTKISPCKDKSPDADILIDEYKTGSDEIDYHISSKNDSKQDTKQQETIFSPKDYFLQSGRKNSERALQIIQENSKILSRILTKQNLLGEKPIDESSGNIPHKMEIFKTPPFEKPIKIEVFNCTFLKESNSDSLIGLYKKRSNINECTENNDVRVRPISIDDPFSLETRNKSLNSKCIKLNKSPSVESLPNKTDLYGWENKGFLAKHRSNDLTGDNNSKQNSQIDVLSTHTFSDESTHTKPSEWRHSYSGESKISDTLPSLETKDTVSYDRKYSYISDDYNYPLSKKYNDYVLSKASDICSKTVDQGPKICEHASKTDNSQVSDFAHVVTSSISFTYEPSGEDDSPFGAKSNSSDTLCQIASLDQVSTPISPKGFPKETSSLPKDFLDKSDRVKFDSDDTCSAITSLIETDTVSSLSYPRSPSTGSYHPFPTRPALRMPKELGVRLGMYPKDVINSSPK